MNARGVAFIASAVAIASTAAVKHEGLRNAAYYDPVKIPTICVGRTTNVKMGDWATTEQCMKWLGQEMTDSIRQADKCIPQHVELTPGQLAAFADIIYNIGPRPVCDIANSTMARHLRAGNVIAACQQFPRWDKAKIMGVHVPLRGLTIRREHNRALCMGEIQ